MDELVAYLCLIAVCLGVAAVVLFAMLIVGAS
jgi:hypothetical protein